MRKEKFAMIDCPPFAIAVGNKRLQPRGARSSKFYFVFCLLYISANQNDQRMYAIFSLPSVCCLGVNYYLALVIADRRKAQSAALTLKSFVNFIGSLARFL